MSNQKTVRVALCQMSCVAEPAINVDKALQLIAKAAEQGASIVCLQELFATPYPCQEEDHTHFDWAEEIPGPTSQRLSAAAKQHEVVIVGSLFERRAPGLYHNTAVTFDTDGQMVGLYRKMHIPDDPHYYEKFYFAPGDLGFTVAKTKVATLGIGVCWDQWFPEAARMFALRGAQIILYPTAIGWLHDEKAEYGKGQHDAWETAMRAHAIANGVFVGAVNRIGTEGAIEFWGKSFVANPNGAILARSTEDKEEVLLVDCSLDDIDAVRTHWPFLRDRRIENYHDLQRRYIDE